MPEVIRKVVSFETLSNIELTSEYKLEFPLIVLQFPQIFYLTVFAFII